VRLIFVKKIAQVLKMKKLLLHILLLSYAVVIFKPVLPFVNDFMGHIFFYTQHMATVHYDHGKYHVHYETAKAAKEEQSSAQRPAGKNIPGSKNDNLTSEHVVTALNLTAFVIAPRNNEYSLQNISSFATAYLENSYPPPRV